MFTAGTATFAAVAAAFIALMAAAVFMAMATVACKVATVIVTAAHPAVNLRVAVSALSALSVADAHTAARSKAEHYRCKCACTLPMVAAYDCRVLAST